MQFVRVADWRHDCPNCPGNVLMLQTDKPDDFVIATGETHTVKDFVEAAFDYAAME